LKRLSCSICLNILVKPVSCGVCQANFCECCINRWLDEKLIIKSCPNRCIFVKAKSPPIVFDLLSELKFTCAHKAKGCEEILGYDQLEKHELSCNFQTKSCKGCSITLPLKELLEHEQTCELILKSCEHCKRMFNKAEFENHDKTACSNTHLKWIVTEKDTIITLLKTENLILTQTLNLNKKHIEENRKLMNESALLLKKIDLEYKIALQCADAKEVLLILKEKALLDDKRLITSLQTKCKVLEDEVRNLKANALEKNS